MAALLAATAATIPVERRAPQQSPAFIEPSAPWGRYGSSNGNMGQRNHRLARKRSVINKIARKSRKVNRQKAKAGKR